MENKYGIADMIVSSMEEGLIILNQNGGVEQLNNAAREILGLPKEKMSFGLGNKDILSDERNDCFLTFILDAVFSKSKVLRSVQKYYINGEVKDLIVTVSYAEYGGGRWMVILLCDISDMVLLAQEQDARKQAEQENQFKSQFLAVMSHEIRTPINAILGMNEMLLRECQEPALVEYASNIQTAGKTLLGLVNDILDLSKIQSQKLELILVEYDLEKFLKDIYLMMHPRANQKGLEFEIVCSGKIPGRYLGDDIRIKQILMNLLSNAIKYTKQGKVQLTVSYDEELTFRVQDTGIGIRKEDMGRLFESFQRLDEKKNRSIEGTGLGMSIIQGLIQLMGGKLEVESTYGEGSVFTARIPQKVIGEETYESFEHLMSKASRVEVSKALFVAPQARILVVDDNDMNLKVIQGLLKRTQVQLLLAQSGSQCIEILRNEEPDLIFMDHMMPDMDGIETLAKLREEKLLKEQTAVIVLTANAIAGAKNTYMEAGFQDYLSKPIDSQKLEEMLVTYLPEDKYRLLTYEEAEGLAASENRKQNNASLKESVGNEINASLKKNVGNEIHASLKANAGNENNASSVDTAQICEDIDLEQGLSYANQDMEFYLQLVQHFIQKIEGRRQELLKYYVENDWKNYAILAHAIKGDARMLGANALADLALQHEMAGKEDNSEYIQLNVIGFFDTMKDTREQFQKLLKVYGAQGSIDTDEGEQKEGTSGLEAASYEEALSEVAKWIDAFEEEKALGLLKALRAKKEYEVYHDILQKMIDAIEYEYDPDLALEMIEAELV